MLAVGLLGAAVNVAAAWQLARAERRSLNVEGARAHVLADLYASLGAAAAGAVVLLTGLREADPVAALLVAALMVRSGWSLLREVEHGAARGHPVRGPHRGRRSRSRGCAGDRRGPRPARVGGHRRASPRWPRTCSCAPGDDCHGRRRELEQLLHDRFGIHHTTLQVDHEAERELLDIEDRR